MHAMTQRNRAHAQQHFAGLSTCVLGNSFHDDFCLFFRLSALPRSEIKVPVSVQCHTGRGPDESCRSSYLQALSAASDVG